MVSREFTQAAVEINSIFENMSDDILSKIPVKIRNFFKEVASKDYIFNYDNSKSLDEQKILPKTKGILALLYRDYICDENDKAEFYEAYNELKNIKEKEKYDFDNVFKPTVETKIEKSIVVAENINKKIIIYKEKEYI